MTYISPTHIGFRFLLLRMFLDTKIWCLAAIIHSTWLVCICNVLIWAIFYLCFGVPSASCKERWLCLHVLWCMMFVILWHIYTCFFKCGDAVPVVCWWTSNWASLHTAVVTQYILCACENWILFSSDSYLLKKMQIWTPNSNFLWHLKKQHEGVFTEWGLLFINSNFLTFVMFLFIVINV